MTYTTRMNKEKMVKEKKEEAWPVVQHALDVIHETFGGINNETI